MRTPPTLHITPISCIIVDDEAFAGKMIAKMVKDIPFLDLRCTTTSPSQGVDLVSTGHIELVFLDMGMAELHGLDFMEITRTQCRIIVTSGYPEYAHHGYEYDVIDYLVKPVDYVKFFKAAQKAQRLLRGGNAEKNLDWLFLRFDGKIIPVKISEILYIESQRNKLIVHTEHVPVTCYMTLQSVEEMLPGKLFIKVHKSFIVSLQKITLVDSDIINIKGREIPIGQTYRNDFIKRVLPS